jgi:hypothetical protein
MCDDEDDVQGSSDIANRDHTLLSKGGPEEKICRREEQVSAQTNGVPELTLSHGGGAKEQNADEDGKAVGLETANGMRRPLRRCEWTDAEEVTDGFGDHRDTPRNDQNERIETQRPRP